MSFVEECWGGKGCSIVEIVLMMEVFGYGCYDNGFMFVLGGYMWSV